ncbi:MAG TPA: hypothetical protein VHC97_19825 [Thermoanaerobaculia bacterium]|jgi:hypothetical protein|nr:hypothetical protein [Thermoanaerobaculia bacterium]
MESNHSEYDLAEELMEAAYYELEEHVGFADAGEGDEVRHLLPPGFLEALAWVATSIIIPMVTGVGSSLIADFVKEKGKNPIRRGPGSRFTTRSKRDEMNRVESLSEELLAQKEEIARLKDEIRRLLRDAPREEPSEMGSNPKQVDALRDFLVSNGWPDDIAEEDAMRVTHSVRDRLRRKG